MDLVSNVCSQAVMAVVNPYEERIKQLSQYNEVLSTEIARVRNENVKLRRRADNQRTELRRLNRRLQAMWEGVRFSQKCRAL